MTRFLRDMIVLISKFAEWKYISTTVAKIFVFWNGGLIHVFSFKQSTSSVNKKDEKEKGKREKNRVFIKQLKLYRYIDLLGWMTDSSTFCYITLVLQRRGTPKRAHDLCFWFSVKYDRLDVTSPGLLQAEIHLCIRNSLMWIEGRIRMMFIRLRSWV